MKREMINKIIHNISDYEPLNYSLKFLDYMIF
ncbi:Uncharacterised protein [Clostridium fallax]|nr:Uncharacterised protein [Clostridium fallax]